jgi:hypothetical protein
VISDLHQILGDSLAMTLLDLKKFWAFCTTAVYDLGAFDVYLCF